MNDSKRRVSKLAVTTLVLACLPFLSKDAGLLGLSAIIIGHIALHNIKKSQGLLTGRGFAIAGLVISYGLLIAAFVFLVLQSKKTSGNTKTVTGQGSGLVKMQKPLPPTKTEDLKQRYQAFAKRNDDPDAKEFEDVVNESLPAIRRVEQLSEDLFEAYGAIDLAAVSRPNLFNKEELITAKEALNRFEEVAFQLKDAGKIHRDAILRSTRERIGIDTASQIAVQTSDNYRKFLSWPNSAIAFAEVAKSHFKAFEETGQIDKELASLMTQMALKYEKIQEGLERESLKQQAKLDDALPR